MVVEGESVAIVVTLNSDPGEDIEVQFRLGETGADDVTFTPDRIAWTATDWEQPRTVEVAAVADEVRERVEPHELQVWTYSGGKTGPDQHILVKETIQLTLADSRGLVALTGGSEGEVVLEWTPADQRTQRWQYRKRLFSEAWSAWLDVPDSGASTRSLRITGLSSYSRYEFQVRAWRRAGAGAASNVGDGVTAMFGSDGIAEAEPGFCLERGRWFRFGPDFTLLTPLGTVICVGGGGGYTPTGESVVIADLFDQTTGAFATLDVGTGEMIIKTFWDSATNSYEAIWIRTGEIIESSSGGLPPPPGYDLSALWDEIEQSIRREPLP